MDGASVDREVRARLEETQAEVRRLKEALAQSRASTERAAAGARDDEVRALAAQVASAAQELERLRVGHAEERSQLRGQVKALEEEVARRGRELERLAEALEKARARRTGRSFGLVAWFKSLGVNEEAETLRQELEALRQEVGRLQKLLSLKRLGRRR